MEKRYPSGRLVFNLARIVNSSSKARKILCDKSVERFIIAQIFQVLNLLNFGGTMSRAGLRKLAFRLIFGT